MLEEINDNLLLLNNNQTQSIKKCFIFNMSKCDFIISTILIFSIIITIIILSI